MDNRDARFDLASSLITSENGVVHSQVCSPNKTLGLHTRQTGPGPWCLIPRDLSEAQQGSVREIDVYFGGLLYPNRARILDRVAQGLEKQLVNYLYTSKNHVPWIEYLKILSRSKVVVHTSTYSENKRVTQFHNKAMEATQMGCLLIAQQTEELDEFFGPFEGYVPFTTADEAVQMCLDYLENTSERERISQHGHGLATSYATTLRPWPEIFDAIGVRRPPTAIS
jgi:glycosyltransferase involved in cell wall biosynthesis